MEAGRSDFDTVVRTRSRRRRRKSERNMSDHPNALVRVFVYHLHKDDQILAEHAFCIDVQHRTQTCNTVRASDTCKAKSSTQRQHLPSARRVTPMCMSVAICQIRKHVSCKSLAFLARTCDLCWAFTSHAASPLSRVLSAPSTARVAESEPRQVPSDLT